MPAFDTPLPTTILPGSTPGPAARLNDTNARVNEAHLWAERTALRDIRSMLHTTWDVAAEGTVAQVTKEGQFLGFRFVVRAKATTSATGSYPLIEGLPASFRPQINGVFGFLYRFTGSGGPLCLALESLGPDLIRVRNMDDDSPFALTENVGYAGMVSAFSHFRGTAADIPGTLV